VSAIATGLNASDDYAKRWQSPGDEAHTSVPSIQYPPFDINRSTFYNYSSVLVSKGDHIRLQDININYELTKSQWSRLPFSQVNFYCYISNVGILWRANDYRLDPDLPNGVGIPAGRSVSFGFNAKF
jgi:hypothetical protein